MKNAERSAGLRDARQFSPILRNAVKRRCASVMTLAAASVAWPTWVQAQEEKVEEVVVIGVRESLATAQEIKMEADTFVDSITASDIGAFPDKSVAEALQRVPGITVSRLQSSDDSNHFSAEPATVLIRGLTFVRTEFNGRDSFSADGYRGLNFNDISPELMAGVDSYKNQTAEMIEGGIAGSVNLRTRLPFDSEGQVISLTGRANYGETADATTYEASGIYSNVWDISAGRVGAMVNYAYSHVKTQTEGVLMHRIGAFCNDPNVNNPTVSADGSIPCSSSPYGGSGWQYMPRQVNFSQVLYDRERTGASAALQFESSDGDVLATVQYMDSQYDNPWLERSSNVGFFDLWGAPAYSPQTNAFIGPAAGTPAFTFGPNGMLQSGVLTRPSGSGDWFGTDAEIANRASAVPGLPFVNSCVDGCATNRQGVDVTNEARNFGHTEGTRDISANLRWDVGDNMRFTFDAQHIEAETNNYDMLVASRTLADVQYSTNSDGTPSIRLLPGSNVNYAPGGLSNPHNYYIPFIQDHWEDNDAEENAFRVDFEYDISDTGWLDSLKVGVRHADREQQVRYSSFNWSPVAAPWNCNGPGFNVDNTAPANYAVCGNPGRQFLGYGEGIWESTTLGDFYNGSVYDNAPLVYLNRPTLGNRDAHIEALSSATTGSPLAWNPLCTRTNNVEGCFTAPELVDVNETSKALYFMLKFGGADSELFGMSVRGNVGVRYVETDVTSNGGVAFPTPNWYNDAAAGAPCGTPLTGANVTQITCWLTPDLLAFSNAGGAENSIDTTYENWLPSFNVRFGITDQQFVRFGYSRAMSRPDFGLLRNYVGIQAPPINVTADSPYVIRNASGAVTGYNFVFNADSGYGALKPITADNFDLSYENYFGKSSSFTVGLFYKKLNGAISYGEFDREFENNGSTQAVTVRGPNNGESDGTLKGVEVGFQTFFDFLPGAWSGLGAQLNYTHVDQSNINNSNLSVQPGYAAGGTIAFGGGLQVNGAVIDSHRLQGISDDSYNIVGLYEYGPIAARLAYSWRSEFLTANLDCCIGLPMYQDDAGYLDGSLRYMINDNIEVSLDATNLLDTTAVNRMQIFGDTEATPGAKPVLIDSGWTRSGRRYQLGFRLKF